MASKLRLWQRDQDIITEAGRSPLLTRQIARLLNFPSTKKCAERLCLLHRAGLLKREPSYQPAMRGKAENQYRTGARPHPRTLPHTIAIADVRVQAAEWQRTVPSYNIDFFYSYEVSTTSGLRPDATLLVHHAGRTALVFVEIDLGTEPVTSTLGYSLLGKLRSYADYFDAGAYQQDFSWAGTLRGFRVALIVPAGRLPQVQHVVTAEHHDFVLLTTSERCKQGFHHAIWVNHDGVTVDVLGRPGDLVGDSMGEQVKPPIPTTPRSNPRPGNNFGLGAGEGF